MPMPPSTDQHRCRARIWAYRVLAYAKFFMASAATAFEPTGCGEGWRFAPADHDHARVVGGLVKLHGDDVAASVDGAGGQDG